MTRQNKFKPLTLKGNEKPRIAPTDRLCNMPGCFKYIDMGEWMVRWGTFDVHVSCAGSWCNERGVEHQYDQKAQ